MIIEIDPRLLGIFRHIHEPSSISTDPTEGVKKARFYSSTRKPPHC